VAKEYVRVEIGFAAGQIPSWLVAPESADALDRNLGAGASGSLTLDASEGTVTVVLDRIVYAKRYARESRVGFAD
jgi:hypothetical protein